MEASQTENIFVEKRSDTFSVGDSPAKKKNPFLASDLLLK